MEVGRRHPVMIRIVIADSVDFASMCTIDGNRSGRVRSRFFD